MHTDSEDRHAARGRQAKMPAPLWCFGLAAALTVSAPALSQSFGQQDPAVKKVPKGVILVKGAWSSASDTTTPVPEGATIADNIFRDPYFDITYSLPAEWTEKYKGPPPSDSGRYVLAQLSPLETFKGLARGNILITAQDMFFAPAQGSDSTGPIDYMKDHLQADYKVETPPAQIKIGGRIFTFFAYWSPVAQLHWYVLDTQIRCHTLEVVLTSRDTKLLDGLFRDMKMGFSAEAGSTGPICIKDYARDENTIARVDPVFTEHRFNRVPVRIIIDKGGKVKHIHFLSAFSDQAKAISDALGQWRFKPYRKNGQPVEVETGILFGRGTFR